MEDNQQQFDNQAAGQSLAQIASASFSRSRKLKSKADSIRRINSAR
jgi:hypothetical protein